MPGFLVPTLRSHAERGNEKTGVNPEPTSAILHQGEGLDQTVKIREAPVLFSAKYVQLGNLLDHRLTLAIWLFVKKLSKSEPHMMESKDKVDLLVRLLQLEQRFESYSRLYDEEMDEIKETLLSLREDVLKLAQAAEGTPTTDGELSQTGDHDPIEETTLDHFSADMSI